MKVGSMSSARPAGSSPWSWTTWGMPLRVGVAKEVAERGLGPRADVENLERAGAGQVAPRDVADGVATRFTRGEVDGGQVAQQRRHALERHEVELDVLPRGDVAPP